MVSGNFILHSDIYNQDQPVLHVCKLTKEHPVTLQVSLSVTVHSVSFGLLQSLRMTTFNGGSWHISGVFVIISKI